MEHTQKKVEQKLLLTLPLNAMTVYQLALGALLLALFLWGANCQSRQVNIDMDTTDQDAYRTYTKQLVETNYQQLGDRNRMPLYPYLLSLFYQPPMSDEALFAVAKQVNSLLTLVVLLITGVIFWFYAPGTDAIVALLVAAFTVFAYRAPYFQAEVLFYGLSFLLFVLLLEIVQRPRWLVALLAGVVAGLAHLTKASILPAVVLACVFLGVQALIRGYRAWRPRSAVPKPGWRPVATPILAAIVFVLLFLAVVLPYIRVSKERFGHYFYNVNSTFYVWYDSWEEVKQGTRAHGDRVGWPDMPAEQIPSLGKYVREHSLQQIAERFTQGLKIVWNMVMTSYGYGLFVLLYALAGALLLWQGRQHFGALLRQSDQLVLIGFVLCYFVSYLLLYAWYTRIAYGNRFVLALFLPLLFCFVRLLGYGRRQELTMTLGGVTTPVAAISGFVGLMLGGYLLAVYPNQVCSLYAGL